MAFPAIRDIPEPRAELSLLIAQAEFFTAKTTEEANTELVSSPSQGLPDRNQTRGLCFTRFFTNSCQRPSRADSITKSQQRIPGTGVQARGKKREEIRERDGGREEGDNLNKLGVEQSHKKFRRNLITYDVSADVNLKTHPPTISLRASLRNTLHGEWRTLPLLMPADHSL